MNNERDIRFLEMAKKLSYKSTEMKRAFGAIIVNNNKIVSLGKNRKSHPKIPKIRSERTGKIYYGLHAEIAALLKCDFPVRGMSVYVHGRNMRSNTPVYSKPCELCERILKERGIKKFVFSTQNGYEVVVHD